MAEPLQIERQVKAPIARVWRALTDIEDLKQWSPFLPDFKAEVGFTTQFMLGPSDDHQYRHLLEVLAVEPPTKLVYRWRYHGYAGDSTVAFELTAKGADVTRLRLTHTVTEPFPADNRDFAAENFAYGWNYTLDAVKQFVEK